MKRYFPLFLLVVLFSSISTVKAAGVVGTGTPASCTETALDAVLAGGGLITFDCGAADHTISISGSKTIIADTRIDGGGRIILDGGRFTQIFYNSGVLLQIQDLTLANARSIQGSAIFNDRGTLEVNTVTFRNNEAVTPGMPGPLSGGRGGAIHNVDGQVTINNSRFLNNRADNWGGAIFTTGGTVTVNDSQFTLNGATSYNGDGGAIANGSRDEAGSTLTIRNSRFGFNFSELIGGAIFSNTGLLTVENTYFGLNIANVGGAMGTETDDLASQIVILGSTFSNNIARYRGGALYAIHPLEINDSTFERNRARAYGGAIYAYTEGAGAIYNSTFMWNNARMGGGAIFNVVNDFALHNSTFAYNNSPRGGALYNPSSLPDDSRRLIRNSTFSGNRADFGGAIYDEPLGRDRPAHVGAYATFVEYSTFAYNRANETGADIYGVQGAIVLRATLLAYSNGDSCNTNIAPVYSVFEYPGTSCGAGRSTDPLLSPLADNGGPTRTHALREGSPAIDAVVAPLVTGTGTVDNPLRCTADFDQRQYARPFDPIGRSGSVYYGRCDIGAYEFRASPATTVTFPLLQTTPEPTLPAVPTQAPLVVDCRPFRATSPLDGLPNGLANFYWDGAPGATEYLVSVINEAGQQVARFNVNAPNTTTTGDVGSGTIGGGTTFTWNVQALYNGRVYCTSQQVSIPRESGGNPPPAIVPTNVPQCGNGIQEPGETPNTCPNGY